MTDAPLLTGAHVRLEPLGLEHVAGLSSAGAGDRSSFGYTYVPFGDEEAKAYVGRALAERDAGRAISYAVLDLGTGLVIGSTGYLDLGVFSWPDPWRSTDSVRPLDGSVASPTVVEIGNTWFAKAAQRTPVNTECKLLMLTHAFESWHTVRVSFKTDARNLQSRTAIARLGASFEGIRRAHVPAFDGTIRNSAYYSILAIEWPEVKVRLQQFLDRA